MDPRFQPENNSPNPQNSASSPQTNSHSLQENPSRHPNLPPAQNLHQNQPYPHYIPSTGGPKGYVPPAHYGNVQGGSSQSENREKAQLTCEIGALEYDLKAGSIKCYICWSYVIVAFSSVITMMILINLLRNYNKVDRALFVIFLSVTLWNIFQSYFAVSAYSNKSLFKANVACWMMSISLVGCVLVDYFFIRMYVDSFTNGSGLDYTIGAIYSIVFSINLLVHIVVNVRNAFKVRKILAERAQLEIRLIDNSFCNNAEQQNGFH